MSNKQFDDVISVTLAVPYRELELAKPRPSAAQRVTTVEEDRSRIMVC